MFVSKGYYSVLYKWGSNLFRRESCYLPWFVTWARVFVRVISVHFTILDERNVRIWIISKMCCCYCWLINFTHFVVYAQEIRPRLCCNICREVLYAIHFNKPNKWKTLFTTIQQQSCAEQRAQLRIPEGQHTMWSLARFLQLLIPETRMKNTNFSILNDKRCTSKMDNRVCQ